MRSLVTFGILAGAMLLMNAASAPAKSAVAPTIGPETELHRIVRKIDDLIDLMRAEKEQRAALAPEPASEPATDADLSSVEKPVTAPLVDLKQVAQIAYTQEETQRARQDARQRGSDQYEQKQAAPSPTPPPVGMEPSQVPMKTVVAPTQNQVQYQACSPGMMCSQQAYGSYGNQNYASRAEMRQARRANNGGPVRRVGRFIFGGGRGC